MLERSAPVFLANRVLPVALIVATCAPPVANATGDALGAFVKNWQGRRVVLKQTLYTVVYDEVGRMGITYRGKLAGLTVATAGGKYFEFDGPGGDEDIAEMDPNRVVDLMSSRFRRAYHMDIGYVQTIKPLLLRRYEPGVTFVVDAVKVQRNRIRFEFRQPDVQEANPFATSLTVEWPVPFSRAFTEHAIVDGILLRFIDTPEQVG